MSDSANAAWTVTYLRHGREYTLKLRTLEHAVGFAVAGQETWAYDVERIIGPDGEVIEGDELADATLHYMLGKDDHDRCRAAKWGPRLGVRS